GGAPPVAGPARGGALRPATAAARRPLRRSAGGAARGGRAHRRLPAARADAVLAVAAGDGLRAASDAPASPPRGRPPGRWPRGGAAADVLGPPGQATARPQHAVAPGGPGRRAPGRGRPGDNLVAQLRGTVEPAGGRGARYRAGRGQQAPGAGAAAAQGRLRRPAFRVRRMNAAPPSTLEEQVGRIADEFL